MLYETSGIAKIVLAILFFPMFFQAGFIEFAWGAQDPTWIMLAKRLLLLLPVCAIILGCWASIACLLTVPVRHSRREFIVALFITWWDLGKSIVAYWGGLVKALLHFLGATVGLMRIALAGLWSLIYDMALAPFGLMRNIGQRVVSSPIPWIAVTLTIAWCVVETTIFTYVMTPLVVDTFSNITGETLSEAFVRIPLFIFLLFIVLGSYAVLSTFVDSVRHKSISSIAGIGVIEIVVLFVEVVFLYREFVDSLVPWFAQYSQNFELGIFWTLAIACFAWFGIRSLSWFLFASHGTPTIMAVIQGRGIKLQSRSKAPRTRILEISGEYMDRVKGESQWLRAKGEELMAAFMLPPLQIVAAGINFCTLLVITNHLFKLPFKDMSSVRYSESVVKSLGRMAPSPHAEDASQPRKARRLTPEPASGQSEVEPTLQTMTSPTGSEGE